ncbi:MAG TPA: AAA family ATPase, partial [Rudaea sp.]|nr:AAA family ATPase [Rudaea sp.]
MFGNIRDIADKDPDTFPARQPVSSRECPTPQLLERDSFLELLSADLASAAVGAGRTVLVSGEAGIGKTSLLEHFVQTHPTARVLRGACEALFTPHPLGPLHDLARHSHARLKSLLGECADRAVLFSAVLDELMAAPAPTLLILEDIQWADAATLDLIRFLGRRIDQAPALMILSYRDDEVDSTNLLRATLGHLPARHVTRLPLPRLSADAVAQLARVATRADDGLYAATGGNPFFVTEALANPHGGVPATIRDAVLARVATLKPPAREVLELASIVPRAIETWLIEALLAAPAEALEECVAGGLLLAEARTLRFRHELARVAVAESMPRQRSRSLHARALAALRQQSSEPVALARLVHHADLAEDSAAVLQLAPRAAREAASRGARREAAAHCRMALTLAYRLSDGDRAALLDDYASHCFELHDLANAIRARETAVELFGRTGDLARQSEALSRHAIPLVRAFRNADADAASQRAIAIAATLPPGPRLGSALATEAYLRMLDRDYADAITWGHKAIALAEQHRDNETLAAAYNSVGAALMFVDYARGCEYLRTGLRLAG